MISYSITFYSTLTKTNKYTQTQTNTYIDSHIPLSSFTTYVSAKGAPYTSGDRQQTDHDIYKIKNHNANTNINICGYCHHRKQDIGSDKLKHIFTNIFTATKFSQTLVKPILLSSLTQTEFSTLTILDSFSLFKSHTISQIHTFTKIKEYGKESGMYFLAFTIMGSLAFAH